MISQYIAPDGTVFGEFGDSAGVPDGEFAGEAAVDKHII